ncbi:low specificity L-threonine aldolase [Nocardia sp. CDC159]|uniref:L-threonine aldolase n=1 Tax=Nocardia pulmonis TaxID=2951408 RepID=A0A9X2J169_9NOCA|nr:MULTISPECIES: low specificity L-threonine aldolase [Nocardia]MCM6778584.1 low specificity L-threonine aldolase [Nocardia pulmonis]MCM6791473.1 low specificity L-threonine aldolase [Nocardia sp. CDC159]
MNTEFGSDNTAGTPRQILDAVAAAAAGQAPPYGADSWTASLERRLGEIFEREVHITLVNTGTAANALSLACLTPPWGGVLCHRDSHLIGDECGAPEFFTAGARLVTLGGANTKIDPDELAAAVRRGAGDPHKVQPSALSITQVTETGSVYTLPEIRRLTGIAKEAGLRVHMDGARFANALVALDCTPAELTWRAGVDVLSFGTTKNGTMTAEAIVLFDRDLAPELTYRVKRSGQLGSKLRFQAAQILGYLADDLWLHNARHANAMAARLRAGLAAVGFAIVGDPRANIVFCQLPQRIIDDLHGLGFGFHADRWGPGICRFVTSFATTADDVDALARAAERVAA